MDYQERLPDANEPSTEAKSLLVEGLLTMIKANQKFREGDKVRDLIILLLISIPISFIVGQLYRILEQWWLQH